MAGLASLVLVSRPQVISAHGGVFPFDRYPAWSKLAPAPEPRVHVDPRVDAFAKRMAGTMLAGLHLEKIDTALRTRGWHSRGSPAVASLFLELEDKAGRNELVARHMAAELERIYALSFCFRPLWDLAKKERCFLEVWFMLSGAK